MTDQPTVRLSIRGVLLEDDKILLSRYVTDGKTWYVTPGGGLHHNEMIAEGVEREVLEETGYTVRSECLVGMREVISDRMPTNHLPVGFHQVELFCRVKRNVDVPVKEPAERDKDQVDCVWMPIKELDQHTVYPKNLGEIIERAKKIQEQPYRNFMSKFYELMSWV